jgi:hypothetical protein
LSPITACDGKIATFSKPLRFRHEYSMSEILDYARLL